MPVPWLQIVQLVPSILDVSRDLMKKTRRASPPADGTENSDIVDRIVALEDNERRQAELVNQMAEQISGLTRAVTVLHSQLRWAIGSASLAAVIAIAALIAAVR